MNDSANRSATFGIIAVVFGFVAFAGAIGHFFAGPIDPPPKIERTIAETAAEIRNATVAKLKGEEYEYKEERTYRSLDDYVKYALLGSGSLAILMAVIGFVRHENLRASIAGGSLGAMGIAFQVAMVMFFALLFVFLVSAVLDKLSFDIFS